MLETSTTLEVAQMHTNTPVPARFGAHDARAQKKHDKVALDGGKGNPSKWSTDRGLLTSSDLFFHVIYHHVGAERSGNRVANWVMSKY